MNLVKRGNVWWVTIGSRKNRLRQSTGKTDYEEALKVAEKMRLVRELDSDAERIQVAAAMASGIRAQGDEIRRELSRTPLASVWAKIGGYRGNGRRPIRESSVKAARSAWEMFVSFAAARKVEYAEEATPELAEEFLRERGTGRAAETAWLYCRAVMAHAGIAPNPFAKKPPLQKSDTHHEPLSRPQISALLAEVDRLASMTGAKKDAGEFALFIRFLLYTGLRLGDAATARVAQIDFTTDPPMLSREQGKVGKTVRFPLHPALVGKLPREGDYIFPLLAATYLSGHKALSKRIARLLDKLDIKGERCEYSAHSFRTTCATICAEEGVPMAVIQSWLGHSSPMVTRIYTRVETDRQKAQALSKFPDLG
ncbi:MAG: site-specific integrase [Victivallales bacterium]|nr:site-specific integrase [Victivallales bacterium]